MDPMCTHKTETRRKEIAQTVINSSRIWVAHFFLCAFLNISEFSTVTTFIHQEKKPQNFIFSFIPKKFFLYLLFLFFSSNSWELTEIRIEGRGKPK
jgi:hypothetical protein